MLGYGRGRAVHGMWDVNGKVGGQVRDRAGLEGQHKDCGRLNKATRSRLGVCLHEQACPLGRLIVGHVEDG